MKTKWSVASSDGTFPDYDEQEDVMQSEDRLHDEAMIWLDANRSFFYPETRSILTLSKQQMAAAMTSFAGKCRCRYCEFHDSEPIIKRKRIEKNDNRTIT